MNTQKLLNSPEKKPETKVEAKTTRINSLIEITGDIKKSSKKLRKLFETNSYQKRTQLSVLTRYKKRIEEIDKKEESNQKRLSKKKLTPKNSIPKFKSNFFSTGNDPFASLAQLAAWKSFMNFSDGNLMPALGQALLAGGLAIGPSLVGGAVSGLASKLGSNKIPRGFDATGRRVSTSTQNRYRQRFGDRAFEKRFGKDALKRSKTASTAGDVVKATTKSGRVAKSFGKFGAAIIPGVGAVVGAADAALRAQAGDITGASIAGTSASLDALAAASAATGIGLPIAGLLSIGSFALDVTNLARDLLGISAREEEKNQKLKKEKTKTQERLTEQTKKQKEESRKVKTGLTFSKTLNSYSKAIKKLEEFSKGFTGRSLVDSSEEGINYPEPRQLTSAEEYTGPVSGDTFFPLPGGQAGEQAGQEFGAPRGGRSHEGVDITKQTGDLAAPVIAYKTGKVITSIANGYNGHVILSHGNGLQTMYYHITPGVQVGQTVYGGQQLGTLYPAGQSTHLHFEIIRNGTKVNPIAAGIGKNKIPAPLSAAKAKELFETKSKPQPATPQPATPQATRSPSGGIHGTEFDISGTKFYQGSDKKYYEKSGDRKRAISEDEYWKWKDMYEKFLLQEKNNRRSSINPVPSANLAMNRIPPTKVIDIPVPLPQSDQIYPATNQSIALNSSTDTEAKLLKALMYKASA